MKRYERYVIYADYDGTLTDRPGLINPGNIPAIREFIEGGGRFALSSGRDDTLFISQKIPTNVPSILQNGALIAEIGGKEYRHLYCDQEQIGRLFKDLYRRFPSLGIFLAANQPYFARIIRPIQGIEATIRTPEQILFLVRKSGVHIKGICLDSDSNDIDEASAFIDQYYPDLKAVYSAPGHMDVIRRDVSKGSALEWLRKNFFTSSDILIGIGDNTNDTELLLHADIGLAMGNGTRELKKIADGILPDCTVPCVRSAMNWINKNTEVRSLSDW